MDSKGKKLLFFRKYLLEIMRLTIKHDSMDKKQQNVRFNDLMN